MQYNITYRQKDKGWQYIISYKDKGAWKQKSKQGFETKKKASLAATERVKEIEKRLDLEEALEPEYTGITFLEFANELIEHEKLYKEWNTIVSYNQAVKSFHGLHKIPLKDIKHIHIQRSVDELAENDIKVSTIKLHTSKITYILNQAVEPYKILANNPIGKMKYPSETMEEQNVKIKALTKDETGKLLVQLKERNFKQYVISLMAVTTGLRIGELLGLIWEDIDFPNATINVNKQWKKIKNGSSGFGKLKRKNSYRVVPLLTKPYAFC